jgi:hypothetical protein
MTTTATTVLAKAEASGLYLRLGPDGEILQEGPAPSPELLAELRRVWEDVVGLLLLRHAMGAPHPPGWLDSVAQAIHDALAAGARQETDSDGWLYLTAPDGQRLVVAPDTLLQIIRADLLRPVAEAEAPTEEAEPRERRQA